MMNSLLRHIIIDSISVVGDLFQASTGTFCRCQNLKNTQISVVSPDFDTHFEYINSYMGVLTRILPYVHAFAKNRLLAMVYLNNKHVQIRFTQYWFNSELRILIWEWTSALDMSSYYYYSYYYSSSYYSYLLKNITLYWELGLQTSYTPWGALVGHFGGNIFLGTMPKKM